MSSLLETCERVFGTKNLYEVLRVDKNFTDNQLKKAYHKVSLKVHPDRVTNEDKEEATQKFQTLGQVYTLLSDKDRRSIYDETGEVDDETAAPSDRDWNEYWRLMFKKVDFEDIKNFEAEYRESAEELDDLKAAYVDGKGDMDYIIHNVLCCTVEDEERFRKIINGWIKKNEVPDFDTFSKENQKKKNARKSRAAAEAKEAEKMKQEFGLGDNTNSLEALILKRNKNRAEEMDSFLDNLASKYGGGKKKAKKTK